MRYVQRVFARPPCRICAGQYLRRVRAVAPYPARFAVFRSVLFPNLFPNCGCWLRQLRATQARGRRHEFNGCTDSTAADATSESQTRTIEPPLEMTPASAETDSSQTDCDEPSTLSRHVIAFRPMGVTVSTASVPFGNYWRGAASPHVCGRCVHGPAADRGRRTTGPAQPAAPTTLLPREHLPPPLRRHPNPPPRRRSET